MKLIMTLLIRDEEDILRENLLYHLHQEVDYFIVTDNLSVDHSADILKEFEASGLLLYIKEKQDNYAQAEWVTKMARLARTQFNADWVINGDADEFWWPKVGTLKNTLERIHNEFAVVSVKRHNFLPQRDIARQSIKFMTLRHFQSTNSLGQPLPPKVCHRGDEDIQVGMGNHSVTSSKQLTMFPETPLEIFHYPIRSYSQFKNKILKGGAALERNQFDPTIGGTWRALYSTLKNGKLQDYFNSEILSDEQIANGLQKNTLVIDERLNRFLVENKII